MNDSLFPLDESTLDVKVHLFLMGDCHEQEWNQVFVGGVVGNGMCNAGQRVSRQRSASRGKQAC